MKKRIIISVSNDLYSDQRVRKTCQSLYQMGFDIQLLGRLLPDSEPIPHKDYSIKRFKLVFNKGPIFYACLNIRLFIYLLFKKTDLLLANDLDTLLANFLISKIKGIPLVYDSHEYFTEVPELQNRSAKKAWEKIEKYIFPKLKDVFTVNDSIANIYFNKYGIKLNVLRNLPDTNIDFKPQARETLSVPNSPYIIMQGAGINIDRGAEEVVMAMKNVHLAKLLIVGSGDVLPLLKSMVKENKLEEKVLFVQRQTPELLKSYTYYAELGLTMDKDTNLNYRYSLPNKIFDYIQAGIPVLASDLPEVKKIVIDNNLGMICKSHNPNEVADYINTMLEGNYKNKLKENIENAKKSLNWESQEYIIKQVYQKYL